MVCVNAQSQQQQEQQQEQQDFAWRGADEFTPLGDRVDAPPLPLPPIAARRRVVLVRHGQSTWNAEGRIQGSSDWSELTDKGRAQAGVTRDMLAGETFDALFVSPLRRARQTADIVAGGRGLEPRVLRALREVDLYSFQGLLKAEGVARFGAQFAAWQRDPAAFEIDSHAPVRELWHRGSVAWQTILTECGGGGSGSGGSSGTATGNGGGGGPTACALVVAHNAVNQALLGTALGLGPALFRRLVQSNGATSVLDFEPPAVPGAPPRVTVDRLNQSPDSPFARDAAAKPPSAAPSRVVIVRHAATSGTEDGVLLGTRDEPLSPAGVAQAGRVAEALMDARVDALLSSPARRCAATAELIAGLQGAPRFGGHAGGGSGSSSGSGGRAGLARVLMLPELGNLELGLWEGQPGAALRGRPLPPDAEDLAEFWARTAAAWARVLAEAAPRSDRLRDGPGGGGGSGDASAGGGGGGGRTVVVVAHAAVAAALVCHCLGLGPEGLPLFRFSPGGISIIDLPPPGSPTTTGGSVRTLNSTAHLGRWAAPITPDDVAGDVCGIDGCF